VKDDGGVDPSCRSRLLFWSGGGGDDGGYVDAQTEKNTAPRRRSLPFIVGAARRLGRRDSRVPVRRYSAFIAVAAAAVHDRATRSDATCQRSCARCLLLCSCSRAIAIDDPFPIATWPRARTLQYESICIFTRACVCMCVYPSRYLPDRRKTPLAFRAILS